MGLDADYVISFSVLLKIWKLGVKPCRRQNEEVFLEPQRKFIFPVDNPYKLFSPTLVEKRILNICLKSLFWSIKDSLQGRRCFPYKFAGFVWDCLRFSWEGVWVTERCCVSSMHLFVDAGRRAFIGSGICQSVYLQCQLDICYTAWKRDQFTGNNFFEVSNCQILHL